MTHKCICQQQAQKCQHSSSKCFSKLWLFDDFTLSEYEILESIGQLKSIPKGQAVFAQGSSADSIFLIKAGRVKLTKYLEDGSELTLDYRQGGEVFGENVFSSEGIYPMTAWALEDTITCGAKKSDLEKIILKHPNIGLTILKNMSQKMGRLSERLENLSIANLEERLYLILKNIAKEHHFKLKPGLQIAFPITHEDLSFLVNAHRVSVSKAMKKLLESGRILKDGKFFSFPEE